jgi:hypothetical protein
VTERAQAWWRALDPGLRAAIIAGLLMRVALLALFPSGCTRDECTYIGLAESIVSGGGYRDSAVGWVWAPLYPHLLALCDVLLIDPHAMKGVQTALWPVMAWVMFALGVRLDGARAGRVAAWLMAVHPTQAYFSGTLWSESLYTLLLMGTVLGVLRARDHGPTSAAWPGALLGLGILSRGVATYVGPLLWVGLLWPGGASSGASAWRRARHVVVFALATAVVVAPYSLWASARFGGFMISDATMGQMMWLGNNDFEPVTFDYGNGLLTARVYDAHTSKGRAHCSDALPPAQWNACETANGVAWIKENPEAFVRRMPLRVAQLVNPHTFVTRQVRWGKWDLLPWALREAVVLWVAAWSFFVMIGGTIAICLVGRGPYLWIAASTVAYHVAAIAALAGLSRYRVPLEPLWMLPLAVAIANPAAARAGLKQPIRVVAAVALVAALFPLMLWFFPTGFPGFW